MRTSTWRAARLRRAMGVLVATVGLVGGCGGPGAATPSATPSAASDTGPLALTTGNLGMEALSVGALEIIDRCTFTVGPDGERTMLAWPAPVTLWDAAAEVIVFRRLDGEERRVGDGDAVSLGGGGSSLAEDGLDAVDWVARYEWVVPPDPACVLDTRWLVSDVLP